MDKSGKVSVLDAMMRAVADCEYLSDLCSANQRDRAQMAKAVKKIAPQDASLDVWRDALTYMGMDGHVTSCEEARQKLIDGLQN